MSLGPVDNRITQAPKNAPATPAAEAKATPAADQATTTATEEAKKVDPEAKDATRQLQQGNEDAIRQRIEGQQGGEWLEARGRKRGGRGGRVLAQGPTRGLGGGDLA